MNARQTTSKVCRTSALVVLALPLVAGSALAATYDLVATSFVKTMPDGTPVTMWGYALDGASCAAPPCAASAPGPALDVPAGDASLTINLRNTLPEPVSVVIPGQAMPTDPLGGPLAPVKFSDAQGRLRVRAFTAEAAVAGGTRSYTWSNLKPGTYLYHSGSHPQVQVQMGLYGAVTHDAAAGQAYAGVAYSGQVNLLFSEIDPDLHAAVANGQYGPGQAMSSTIDYAPRWFLINGAPYADGDPPLPTGSAGQPTLLRLLNAGLQSRSPMLQGQHMRLVAEDGNPYPHAREQYSAFLPALKTLDAVITPAAAATYPLYDRRLALTNPGNGAGGMLAFLAVAGAPSGAPLAANDAYATDEDSPLIVGAIAGVLANDDPVTTAQWHSGPSHGSVNLAADGSFTYTPAADFSGADSFTYQAVSGGLASLPATVSLTVNPVNDAPVAANDAYSVPAGTMLNVAAPGVLGNDSDVDGGALSAVNASALAGLALNPDGSFSYVAPATAGSYGFTYQASDGSATSAAATVTITVIANQAPVAVKDTFNVSRNSTGNVLNVAANDVDPDGNLAPATVTVVVAPNKGGTATANGNGTVTYAPARNFRGSENFSYRVQDAGGLWSNTAIVKVNVK
jgi:FtsP/CotA-like multicopper oxidase with cupredoxin domain